MVLAMVPMVHSGCGLNFGLPLGIISGLLGATLSIELGFTGPMSFVMAIAIATPFALLLGGGYGWLLNKIKGGEMMVATYVGFSSVSFMCMMWLLLPYKHPTMVWGFSASGLRTVISLEGYYDKALANILTIDLNSIGINLVIPTGTLLFFVLLAVLMWAFLHTKTGTAMTAVGSNPAFARAAGINVDKMRLISVIMSTWLDRPLTVAGRVMVKTEDGIRTEAFDPAKLADPSLIIYHPVRTMGSDLVVTNGDQTDTICEHGDFRRGLMTREYEPDEPNWTPRISAIVHEDGSFEMSILKHNDGRCLREFFCYEGCDADKAYFISTYQGDGTPLPTFAGEPMEVSVPSPEEVWDALNEDNKVSLYANMNGEVKLFNKNLGD